MSTAAQKSPVAPAPVAVANPVQLVDEFWMDESISDPAFDDGASDTERIVAAAGAVESLEWELDRAQSALASAVERAASNGCSVEKIAESAGLTKEEVATLLWAARSERSQP